MCQNRSKPNSISDLCMKYLDFNQRIESSTATLTERVFGDINKCFGNMRPGEFQFSQAEEFQRWIVLSGRSTVTANIYVRTARPVFRWAKRNGWISNDPFEYLKKFNVPEEEIRIYESEEFERLIRACRSRLWQARIMLAKTAALRKGEILNLTVRDIDFEHGVITVRPKKEDKLHWRWTSKSKKIRKVPLPDSVNSFLVNYVMVDLPEKQPYLMLPERRYIRIQELRRQNLLKDRIRKSPDENWGKPFERIKNRARIVDGTFHDLRRTCITEWLEAGLLPHEVRELAGHASIETTMRYYVTTRRSLLERAKLASQKVIGATGLEPATS